ncbi:hypothetical protein BGZ61DRAFT_531516 [Ilyonectria robusta]|uniref:uncharacterized protein n=1 Tax=Ilyonectria robusta TaxID=1079257 RepID=UPI001E8DDCAD|nr:uncharacterized protein BGZ61DRAFT_531516 [Ilyonectria robusta]KAH8706310.1 hypothetical protein BGZ61DRAFT_531516 [Ilyonectria robusta]
MLGQTVLSAATCVIGFARNCWFPRTFSIAPQPQDGVASYITKGSEGPWDGPKSSLINSTNFEWWYFDAASRSGDQGVAVWFMNSNPARFGLDLPTSNWFIFHARFADGEGMDLVVPAESAVINTFGEGSTGLWEGTGSGWAGATDLSKFTISFDMPDKGITGVVDVTSTAQPRSAIRLAKDSEADLMNIGGMGWAIGAPSGKAIAHVTVGDKKVSFTDGRGYHDHNWGSSLPAWLNWYAISAEVGPFVWTAIEAYKGEEGGYFKNSWLSLNGNIILASFDEDSLFVRPWGNGAEYPPKGFDPQPLGVTISFDAGIHGKYEFNLTSHGNSPGLPIGKGLAKWFGSIEGGKVGGDNYHGVGMFEWLDLAI